MLALAALGSLVTAGPAAADSIVFIKDSNVWLANPDGSGLYQVTLDGTAENPYQSPSQADDGTIVTMRDQPNDGPLYRMKQNGAVLNLIDPAPLQAGPFDPHVSPDGALVAYGHVYSGNVCDLYGCSYETGADVVYTRTDGSTPDGVGSGAGHNTHAPSWIDSSRAMVGLNNTVRTQQPGSDSVQWWYDFDHDPEYFNNAPENIEDGEYAAGHVVVVRGTEAASDNTLQLYTSNGNFTTPPTPTCTVSGASAGPNGGYFADPTFSPDGTNLAWQEGDGVWTMPFACTTQPALLIPGASAPDWGPAPVNPGPREQPVVPVVPPNAVTVTAACKAAKKKVKAAKKRVKKAKKKVKAAGTAKAKTKLKKAKAKLRKAKRRAKKACA